MLSNIIEKLSAIGVFIAALSCTACFPALAVISSMLGISALSVFEGIAINWLLPGFAIAVLLTNLISLIFLKRRSLVFATAKLVAPSLILLALYPLWQTSWRSELIYFAMALMLTLSLLDFLIFKDKKEDCQSCQTLS
jgi:mercuric ion transport protein